RARRARDGARRAPLAASAAARAGPADPRELLHRADDALATLRRSARRAPQRRSARPLMTTRGAVHVGCSGWQYDHWRGRFYPREIPKARWLEHYASVFGTVEINGSFYMLPRAESVEAWRARTPPRFVFAWKASRFLTHMKKLKDPEPALAK